MTSTSSRPRKPPVIHAVPTPVPVPSSSTRPFAGTAAARTASSLPVPGSHDSANPARSARSVARRTDSGTTAGIGHLFTPLAAYVDVYDRIYLVTTIYLVQHGDKERLPGDPGLTELGKRQAEV